jgi:hypothetical protein
METANRAPRWATRLAILLVAVLTVTAFGMSFVALQDLMGRTGANPAVAAGLPVIVDGAIVVGMLLLFVLHDRRSKGVAWVLLIGFAAVSLVCNGVHIAVVFDPARGLGLPFAIFLGTLPPLALLTTSEALVCLLTRSGPEEADEAAEEQEEAEQAAEALPSALPAPAAPVAAPDPVATLVEEPAEPAAEPLAGPAVAAGEPAVEERFDEALLQGHSQAPLAACEDAIRTHEAGADDPVATEGADRAAGLQVVRPEPPTPTEPADQVAWILDEARAGREVTWKVVAERLGLTDRTAQYRLTTARKKDPEAFAA